MYLCAQKGKPQGGGRSSGPSAWSALGTVVKNWIIFGVCTLLVAAPQLPIYWSKAFGGRKVRCVHALCVDHPWVGGIAVRSERGE